MGYMHIENLRRVDTILNFKTCYALEKIHGTSANVAYRDGKVWLSSGGESAVNFAKLFDVEALGIAFMNAGFTPAQTVIIYGEAYGGKQQKMSNTYGKELKFVAFEVKIDENFLAVPHAAAMAAKIGVEFVDWCEVPCTIEAINAERDKPSTQAVRNGIAEPRIREGIVLRPPFETVDGRGNRVIAKHKREEFAERGTPKIDDLDPTTRQIRENAQEIAAEWVTHMRLEHVIDRLISERDDKDPAPKDIPEIIRLMIEDVTREGCGEIVDNKTVRSAIGSRTVALFKARMTAELSGSAVER